MNFVSRWLFRAPNLLWRMGFGPVLGRILMRITTRGRKSGLPRHTTTECHRVGDCLYAPSGLRGNRADWVRNLQADPIATVRTANGMRAMKGTVVDEPVEIARVLEGCWWPVPMRQHLLRARGLSCDPAELVENPDKLCWVRFQLTDEPGPPAPDNDLTWVTILGGVALLVWVLGRPR